MVNINQEAEDEDQNDENLQLQWPVRIENVILDY